MKARRIGSLPDRGRRLLGVMLPVLVMLAFPGAALANGVGDVFVNLVNDAILIIVRVGGLLGAIFFAWKIVQALIAVGTGSSIRLADVVMDFIYLIGCITLLLFAPHIYASLVERLNAAASRGVSIPVLNP